MYIAFHKKFEKSLAKQPREVQLQFKERIVSFISDPFDSRLNNHALIGDLRGTRSINITGNVRVHYEEIKNGVILINIGTHAQLYK